MPNIIFNIPLYILAAASVAQSVQRWSKEPEVAESILSMEDLKLYFSQLIPIESQIVYLSDI